LMLAFLGGFLFVSRAFAQGPDDNSSCLACHSNPNLSKQLPSGETLSLFVDAPVLKDSVHGKSDLKCTQCHVNISEYPHPEVNYSDLRDVAIQNAKTCETCHGDEAHKAADSVHQAALASGNRNAPICTDCHVAHAVTAAAESRVQIPQTCSRCHSEIADEYLASVHGAALVKDNNPDVPTCIDCHNVHNISDPTTASFRANSPQLCAKCHTDPAVMSKYGLSTDVLNTYVADFHGTTVELFAKEHPDQASNKPVCFDCHGVHDIKSTADPASAVSTRANLLKTCQNCHPDATSESFTSAWMSHYQASPTRYPLVYYVNLFYWVVIPMTIGGLVLYVGTDVLRRSRGKRAHKPGEDRKE